MMNNELYMKKNKKRIFFIVFLSLLLIFTLSTILHLTTVKISDIESIEIAVEYGYPHFTYSYKIDFLNKSILNETDNYDENKTFYTDFTDKDAEYFIEKANLYGFFYWNESYETSNTNDGKAVDIFINFKDGSVKKTLCYANFPPNYDKMEEVFYKAFGLII